MKDLLEMRLDKTKISISDSFDNSDEKIYWAERSAEERLLAVEMMRRVAYGYDEKSQGLQRVLEIAQRQ